VIIFATGYMPTFPFLIHPHNDKNHTYPTSQHVNVRQIRNRDDPKIGFIGFNGPGLGVILPLAERQSLLFTSHLLNLTPTSNLPLTPDDEWHHQHVHRSDARVRCRARQLAKDLGIAPSFTEILKLSFTTPRGWRLLYIWAAGSCFNTKFRLIGPWKWDGARAVMTGELWETVK
jgi:dimethylaniline monooxygenase (N-oxide forming)